MRYIGIDLLKVPAPSIAVPLNLEATILGEDQSDATTTSSAMLRLANEPHPFNLRYVDDG